MLRRLRGEPRLPDGSLHRLLVLCHGNICRSPFAAAILAPQLPAHEVRSAGLHAGDGNPADPLALKCAERFGVSLVEHRSKPVDRELMEWADLVLVMQGSDKADIDRRWPRARRRVRLLGDFLASPPYALLDPWGQPEEYFDHVFARLDRAVKTLALRISAGEEPASSRIASR